MSEEFLHRFSCDANANRRRCQWLGQIDHCQRHLSLPGRTSENNGSNEQRSIVHSQGRNVSRAQRTDHLHFVLCRSAELTITLANVGAEAFKPELYGSEIQIVRRIGVRKSGYKILGKSGTRRPLISIDISAADESRQVISTRKETITDIIQALSISPENPLCVLHQEIAKTFLLNSDSKKKYQVSIQFTCLKPCSSSMVRSSSST